MPSRSATRSLSLQSALALLRRSTWSLVAPLGVFALSLALPAQCQPEWLGLPGFEVTTSPGSSPEVACILPLSNGGLMVGGTFSKAGEVAARNIAMFDGFQWSALGSGCPGSVKTMISMPGGDIVAGGTFSSAGGIPAANIARWNGSAWSPLGVGVGGEVAALAVMPNGDLVAAGSFTTAGGGPANRIARWDGSNWSPLGTGANSTVMALAVLPNGNLVAGGRFNQIGGITASCIATWNGSVWAALGTGMQVGFFGGTIRALAASPSGLLYAGGEFLGAGNVPFTGNLGCWGGSSWSSIGSVRAFQPPFMVETTAYVTQIAFRANGDLVVGGTFTHIGSNAVTGIGIANQNIARWDGTSWSGLGAGISPSVRALAVTSDDVPVVENQSHLLERFDCPENYARWTWFGQTCPAAPGLPSIGIDSSRPAIGHDVTLTASQFPVNCTFGGILVSWTRLSPGIDLTSVGMPGCYQHVGPGAYFTFVPVAQSGSHTFPIPLMPALLGAHIHAQAIGLIPGANPTGASTSIGIDLAMGRL